MPIAPLYCTSSTTYVDLVCSTISPTNPISVYPLDYSPIPFSSPTNPSTPFSYYSDLGSLLYDNDFDLDGSGNSTLLDTAGLWINNDRVSGPLLRSGVWTNTNLTDYWLGFNLCFQINDPKLYYIGLGGNDGVTFKINKTTIIQQNIGTAYSENFRYWHIYPIILNRGENVIQVMGIDTSDGGGFGMEIYDNEVSELRTASTINDLNIIFSTINKTGQTFDVVYSSGFTPSTSGYTCESGDTYT